MLLTQAEPKPFAHSNPVKDPLFEMTQDQSSRFDPIKSGKSDCCGESFVNIQTMEFLQHPSPVGKSHTATFNRLRQELIHMKAPEITSDEITSDECYSHFSEYVPSMDMQQLINSSQMKFDGNQVKIELCLSNRHEVIIPRFQKYLTHIHIPQQYKLASLSLWQMDQELLLLHHTTDFQNRSSDAKRPKGFQNRSSDAKRPEGFQNRSSDAKGTIDLMKILSQPLHLYGKPDYYLVLWWKSGIYEPGQHVIFETSQQLPENASPTKQVHLQLQTRARELRWDHPEVIREIAIRSQLPLYDSTQTLIHPGNDQWIEIDTEVNALIIDDSPQDRYYYDLRWTETHQCCHELYEPIKYTIPMGKNILMDYGPWLRTNWKYVIPEGITLSHTTIESCSMNFSNIDRVILRGNNLGFLGGAIIHACGVLSIESGIINGQFEIIQRRHRDLDTIRIIGHDLLCLRHLPTRITYEIFRESKMYMISYPSSFPSEKIRQVGGCWSKETSPFPPPPPPSPPTTGQVTEYHKEGGSYQVKVDPQGHSEACVQTDQIRLSVPYYGWKIAYITSASAPAQTKPCLVRLEVPQDAQTSLTTNGYSGKVRISKGIVRGIYPYEVIGQVAHVTPNSLAEAWSKYDPTFIYRLNEPCVTEYNPDLYLQCAEGLHIFHQVELALRYWGGAQQINWTGPPPQLTIPSAMIDIGTDPINPELATSSSDIGTDSVNPESVTSPPDIGTDPVNPASSSD